MARKERRVPPSRRLLKALPQPPVLLREALRSLWTDAQCDAAGRGVEPRALLKQAEAWLTALQKLGDDAPVTRARLAWLAELTVALRDGVEGRVAPEVEARRKRYEAATRDVERLRARLTSRMTLLVGGDEERRAALHIAAPSLAALSTLLHEWRAEARLRVLADELRLDDGVRAEVQLALEAVSLPVVKPAPLTTLAGRLVRELTALQAALTSLGVKPPPLR